MGGCQSHPQAAPGAPSEAKIVERPVLGPTAGDVKQMYRFEKLLGKGSFGIVHRVVDKKTGEILACKSISKRKLLTHEDEEDVRREVQIMLHLTGHENIVNLKAAYEDNADIHLIMEVCSGGELFDRLVERGHFSEKTAARLVGDMVRTVHHCHLMNVVHRDLKPENFLFAGKEPTASLKATDFGLSRFFKDGQNLDEVVGSPFYVAPEVLRRRYGKSCDIWSCGVIMYVLLAGMPPFHGENTQVVFQKILTQKLDLTIYPWTEISEAAKELLTKMLQKDPRKRLTAQEVLQHPWLAQQGVASDAPLPEVLVRMQKFAGTNKLKREALKVIAKTLPVSELAGIQTMFQEMDADHSGCITVDELTAGLKKKGADLGANEIVEIISGIDADGNALIDYEEFIAATMHLSKLNREENMLAAFQHFDKDNSGYITRDELLKAMHDVDSTAGIDAILSAWDANGDGKIDYQEFCMMMRKTDMETLRSAANALRSKSHNVKAEVPMMSP